MTVTADQRVHLSGSLQTLIDSRLDTIERMLLGRVGRAERMAIVREVESQIHELLGELETEEPSREDVLAVLARLDPPEAFLADDLETESPATVRGPIRSPARTSRSDNKRVGRASGILGLLSLCLLLLVPLSYVPAIVYRDEMPIVLAAAGASFCMFICSVVGITMGADAQERSLALVGMVTSILSLLISLLIGFGLILLV